MKRWLITGAAGFIGANLARMILETREDISVVVLDALTYAGNPDNLAGLEDRFGDRYRFVRGDICDAEVVRSVMDGVDVVLNLAAESHVDRSIVSAAPFVRTNVMGTQTLLSVALEVGVSRFVQVSTDEVYGELPWVDPADLSSDSPRFTEDTPLSPRSPYSASKAGGDLLAQAWHATHGMDVVVTRCSNNYGRYQFPEKLIPLMAVRAMSGQDLPVYGDGLNIRDWIHVDDHCRGIIRATEAGVAGRVYNFGGEAERTNLTLVHAILEFFGASQEQIRYVTDRPGHDRRYAIDIARVRAELDWAPTVTFEHGLQQTLAWYRDNKNWWERVQSGAYREWIETQYGDRLA